jgi:hypothetical protein
MTSCDFPEAVGSREFVANLWHLSPTMGGLAQRDFRANQRPLSAPLIAREGSVE